MNEWIGGHPYLWGRLGGREEGTVVPPIEWVGRGMVEWAEERPPIRIRRSNSSENASTPRELSKQRKSFNIGVIPHRMPYLSNFFQILWTASFSYKKVTCKTIGSLLEHFLATLRQQLKMYQKKGLNCPNFLITNFFILIVQ